MQSPNIPEFVPIMTKARLSALSGIPVGTLNNLIDKGVIPSIKTGESAKSSRLINVSLLNKQCLDLGEYE